MLTTQSKHKVLTVDPCLYSIVGEPETPGQYLKLTIKCSNKEARFSLDYRAVPEKTIAGAFEVLYRINGITFDMTKMKCQQGGGRVELTDKIQAQDNIECSL